MNYLRRWVVAADRVWLVTQIVIDRNYAVMKTPIF
jgi:hypothetical protein